MPAAKIGEAPLWRYYPDTRIASNESVSVEVARKCPECAYGVMNRLSERQFHAPYRWIPVGYRCNKCGLIYIFKRSLV